MIVMMNIKMNIKMRTLKRTEFNSLLIKNNPPGIYQADFFEFLNISPTAGILLLKQQLNNSYPEY